MAISSSVVWEVRSTATAGNANGGGFKTGASGTDFSQQNAAQFSLTGVTTAGADAILLHADAAASMVGNIAFISAGTNFTVGRYEITAVDPGVSITLDRTCTSAAGADGVVAIGGALSLGSSDDAIFETMVAGNKMYVKSGTYTLGGTVSLTSAGGSQQPIIIEGYATTRGDVPTGATRPTFDCGTASFTLAANWDVYYMIFTGTAATLMVTGAGNKMIASKFTNTSGSANRVALQGNTDGFISRCECVSTLGPALKLSANVGITVIACYLHDSDIGLSVTGTGSSVCIHESIIDTCVTAAVSYTGANTASNLIHNCTLYGGETPAGIGVSLATGVTDFRIVNSIIYGFVSGVVHADTQTVGYDNYNDYYNNTTDVTNWTKGPNSVAINPGFVNAAGANFGIGPGLLGLGIPSTIPGSNTTASTDIGAAQAVASSSGNKHIGQRIIG